MSDILSEIRAHQQRASQPQHYQPAEHQPQMLYIGCIDARLDPIADIGIARGKALIYRNIGALVFQEPEAISNTEDFHQWAEGGEIPENIAIGAALEFFIHHIPMPPTKRKHIVISGHTDCGGIKACLHRADKNHSPYLSTYLTTLEQVRAKVQQEIGMSETQKQHLLEEYAVRQSLDNLSQYSMIKRAVAADVLELHGWLINTATSRISEWSEKTNQFTPMSNHPSDA